MSICMNMMCGFPGSGKSTAVKQLSNGEVIICPDDARIALFNTVFDPQYEDEVWKFCTSQANYHLYRKEPIWIDATNLHRKARSKWIEIAKKHDAFIRVFCVDTPFEICCERNKGRDRVVPDEVMKRMYASWQKPLITEDIDLIIMQYGEDY